MARDVPGCRLRVEVERELSGQWVWAEYDNMIVESGNNNYKLHVTGYHGNAGDAFNDDEHLRGWKSNGMQFTTSDVDNDKWRKENCAKWVSRGGWWYNRCSSSRLNSHLPTWYSTGNSTHNERIYIKASRMMLKCGAD